jgi:hypothetical protein
MKSCLFVLLLACLLLAIPAQADRLLTTGLEENNGSATMWSTVNGTFITSPVHSGTYAGQTTSAQIFQRRITAALTSGTLFTRFYFRTGTIPTGARVFFQWFSSGASSGPMLRTLATGAVRLVNSPGGTQDDSTFTLSVDTWYRFELRHLISDTVGELELRIYTGDSTTIEETLSTPVGDTLPGNIIDVRFTAEFATNFFDDISINDESGAVPFNTWPGPGKTFLLEPSGDNTVTWTKDGSSPAATNWEGVDDLPGAPDDGVTYNSKTSNGTDKLDLSNLGAEVPSDADIISVDVYGRQGSTGTTGTRNITYELWDQADSQTTGPTVDCKINGWRRADTDEHLVFDAGSRSKANIDSFRIGYQRNHGGGNEDRITAQWVNVEWIEAAAAPAFRPKVVVY